jgi:hypothetical protein
MLHRGAAQCGTLDAAEEFGESIGVSPTRSFFSSLRGRRACEPLTPVSKPAARELDWAWCCVCAEGMSLQALAHAKERIAQASSLPPNDDDSVDAGVRGSDPASSPSAAAQNAARAATMAAIAGGGSQPRQAPADGREASPAKTAAVQVKRTNSSHPSAWRAPPAALVALRRYTDMHNAMIAARRRRSSTIPSGPVQYAASRHPQAPLQPGSPSAI